MSGTDEALNECGCGLRRLSHAVELLLVQRRHPSDRVGRAVLSDDTDDRLYDG